MGLSALLTQVLERGEKIELLVDKTDRLSQQAVQFKRCVKGEQEK